MRIIYHLSIILLVIFTLYSCESKEETILETKISYKLLDDVSPVLVHLSIDKKQMSWSEWIVDDTLFHHPDSNKNTIEHLFLSKGTSKVEFNGMGEDGNRYHANLTLEIPSIANKLIIKGICFPDLTKNENDSLKIYVRYMVHQESVYSNDTYISCTSFEDADTIVFDQAITIDIPELEEGIDEHNYVVGISIEGENIFYHSNFFIYDTYYIKRALDKSSDIILPTPYNDTLTMSLLADWTRE